ncbi:MAG: hypothetical protein JXA09_05665 [Anaerolineae bacterium]|nr:hypothetical protein [Anaerolineae bacterium]
MTRWAHPSLVLALLVALLCSGCGGWSRIPERATPPEYASPTPRSATATPTSASATATAGPPASAATLAAARPPPFVPDLSVQLEATLTAVADKLATPIPLVPIGPMPATAVPLAVGTTAAPTPTPVPLPSVCLLDAFAGDIANCGAIPRYDIALTVDLDAARVTGHERVTYTNLEGEALDELYLRLYPNAPGYGGAMTVSDLRVDGRVVSTSLLMEETALRVPLSPPLEVGRAVTLDMDYAIDVPTSGRAGHALFSYLQGIMALPTAYPIIPVYDQVGWHLDVAPEYGDDIYADVSIYAVQVTAPADQTVIASGSCAPPMRDGEWATWACEAAPVREFILILSDRFEVANRQVGDVVVNSFYYPEHREGGDLALRAAASSVRIFAELFGPYPFAELDVVETPNLLGGMEYSGLVVIRDGLYPGVVGVEWLAAHEVAHQWWHAVVGNDPVRHPWLDEGLTQYSTMLYYEHLYGAGTGAGIVEAEFVQTYQALVQRGQDLPAGLPAEAYGPVLYWQIVYDVGALYFHNLRQRVGDEAFYAILQAYYARNRYQIATPASLLQAIEDVTGDPQLALYEQWIGALEETPD